MSGEWGDPGKPIPRVPGMCSGLVAMESRGGQVVLTVQCAVCYRTYTDIGVLAMSKISHRGDQGVLTVPYRRCEECREKHAHPESEGVGNG